MKPLTPNELDPLFLCFLTHYYPAVRYQTPPGMWLVQIALPTGAAWWYVEEQLLSALGHVPVLERDPRDASATEPSHARLIQFIEELTAGKRKLINERWVRTTAQAIVKVDPEMRGITALKDLTNKMDEDTTCSG